MATIKVALTKIVDHRFPIFGAFEFTDLSGEVIVIHEKLPVVGANYVEGETNLPMDVQLESTIVSTLGEGVVIDTHEPHAIEDVYGRTEFHIHADIVGG